MPSEPPERRPLHVVIMGVAGCGKSVVGAELRSRLALPLVEGDNFHPPSNIQKMRDGIALTDEDRAEWLQELGRQLRALPAGAVLTCSALRRSYREVLRNAVPELHFVHLSLSAHQALERVAARTDHFYPPSLVASQFSTLEDPAGEPRVHVADATLHVDRIVEAAARWLEGSARSTMRNALR
ncbi:MAG TPA: gluconokinase [Ramlibacter sp.]|jgi:gluconokinase|nr:gluconokinase [Ramlibacter sp.]